MTRRGSITLLLALAVASPLSACGGGPSRGGGNDAGVDPGAETAQPIALYPPTTLGRPLCTLAGPPPTSAGDALVWADEFDGDKVDPQKWNIRSGYEGHSTIVNTFAPGSITVHDGSLWITAVENPKDAPYPYTSGRMDTVERFARSLGRMEMRARFPSAPGVWYAVWSRQWDAYLPEIDIEVLGKATPEVWFVNHWGEKPLAADDRRKAYQSVVDPRQFHVYSVIWKKDLLEWQIDGVPLMQSTRGVPAAPIQWTINGWVGGWGGAPAADTVFPASFEIDYVRVYRQDGVIADPVVRITKVQTKYSSRNDFIVLQAANFDEACFHVEMREGNRLLAAGDKAPFGFPLNVVPPGHHTFTFAATDGARTATTSIDTETY